MLSRNASLNCSVDSVSTVNLPIVKITFTLHTWEQQNITKEIDCKPSICAKIACLKICLSVSTLVDDYENIILLIDFNRIETRNIIEVLYYCSHDSSNISV